MFGGIERVFSHNGGDPLNAVNLPAWCDGVTALDAFDAATILEFSGNRTRTPELATRFGLNKAAERKALAAFIFRLVRQQAPQDVIAALSIAEGERLRRPATKSAPYRIGSPPAGG